MLKCYEIILEITCQPHKLVLILQHQQNLTIMRKLKKLFISANAALIAASAFAAQSSNKEGNTPPIILQRKHEQNIKKIPKAPDMQIITCYYDGEDIFLNLVYNEGMATLSIRDQLNHEEIYYVDSSNLRIQLQVGRLVGSIYIQLETETNKLYEGILE